MLEKEQIIGIALTLGIHAILLLGAYFYVLPQKQQQRAAFIEVTLGEFKSGSPSKQAPVKAEEVKKRVNPGKEVVEEEKPEIPQEKAQEQKAAPVKAADLAKTAPVESEDVIKKTDTDEIDPSRKSADKVTETEPSVTKAEQDKQVAEGPIISGNPQANNGSNNSSPGKGEDQDKSAPYVLKWDGEDIERSTVFNPTPGIIENYNAVVTFRFEVRPDGSVGKIIPIRKSSPTVNQEVQRTIRSWRFSALPANVPQQVQWGTITFRFVLQ